MALMILAPSATFLGICLLVFGVYRVTNHRGVLARRRLAAFLRAAQPAAAAAPAERDPLIGLKRFSRIPTLDRLMSAGWGSKLSLDLARAGLSLTAGEYVVLRIALAALLGILAYQPAGLPGLVVGAGCGYALPALYARWRRGKRLRRFDEQLVEALVVLCNALKSGYSFLQGMETTAREVPDPLGPEFERALEKIRLGGELEEALNDVAMRTRSREFELVRTAIVVQRQVGGNLTEILGNISQTIRQRQRILGEVRVLTADPRLSGNIVAALPFVMAGALSLLTPGYLVGMWHIGPGRILLLAGLVFEAVGLLIIRKLVEIDV